MVRVFVFGTIGCWFESGQVLKSRISNLGALEKGIFTHVVLALITRFSYPGGRMLFDKK